MELTKIHDHLYEIPRQGAMRVPGRIYADAALLRAITADKSPEQVRNVATLPGIVGYSLAMPDMHWGYGFPIGGVAGTDVEEGVISPGGVGYDINCGCRLVRTGLDVEEIRPQLDRIVDRLFREIPCGVGSHGAIPKLSRREAEEVLLRGAAWAVARGLGEADDLARTEDGGCMPGADPARVSDRAKERGLDQLGTLGSGNHFLEIQYVEEVFDRAAAAAMGLARGAVTLMIHSGSRGLGYQVCDDYLRVMARAVDRYRISLPDRQLACAPIGSEEGRAYLAAMACAANFAWANRQILMHLAVEALQRALGTGPRGLGARLVYDVCHNIAKIEEQTVGGRRRRLCVHRKGATRALGPGHALVPEAYRAVGQPVLIPGDMGRASYVCAGTRRAEEETLGSTCHGAGRVLSRHGALKAAKGRAIHRELADRGVIVRARGRKTLAEEMPQAYKDVDAVVEVMHRSGILTKVARLRPVGVIKG